MIYQPIEIILTPIEKGVLLGKFEWPEGHQSLIGIIWNKPYKILAVSLCFKNWNFVIGEPDEKE